MCRQEIPEDYIFNPVLVNPPDKEEGPATKVVATAQVDQEGGEEQEAGFYISIYLFYLSFLVTVHFIRYFLSITVPHSSFVQKYIYRGFFSFPFLLDQKKARF